MARFFNRHNFNSSILSFVLGTFTLTYAVPIQAQNFNIDEAAFLYRVEKLVEKIWKLEKSNNKDKMFATIIDLKTASNHLVMLRSILANTWTRSKRN